MIPVIKKLKEMLEPEGTLYRRVGWKTHNASVPTVRNAYSDAFNAASHAHSLFDRIDTINNLFGPDAAERAAIAVTQDAFNKFIKADIIEKADGRNFFYINIDHVCIVPSNLAPPEDFAGRDFDDLDILIDYIVTFADHNDFDRIKVIAADAGRDDVEVLDWSISRAAMQRLYLDAVKDMFDSAQVLEVIADEGEDDLRADLIAFSINPKEE